MLWKTRTLKADLRTFWHWSRKLSFKILSVLLCWMPKREVDLASVKKVLVIIVGKYGLGDVVLCTPGIRALKQGIPGATLTVLIDQKNTAILADNPFIDKLLIYEKPKAHRKVASMWQWIRLLRKSHFDLAIDFYSYQGIRSALLAFISGAKYRVGRDTDHRGFFFTKKLLPCSHKMHQIERVLEMIESLGISIQKRNPEIFISEHDCQRARQILGQLQIDKNKPIIVFHPGTGAYVASARKWTEERFAQLADRIKREFQANIIFTGSQDEIVTVEQIRSAMQQHAFSVAGKCSIKELAALIQQSQLFISGNTGPMHVAVAVGTPTVSIFSHFDPDDHPDRWKAIGERHVVIQADVGCLSCDRRKCRDFRCLNSITVDDVFDGVKQIIASKLQHNRHLECDGHVQPRKTVTILGVKIDVITPMELIKKINSLFNEADQTTIFYVNPDCLNKAYYSHHYRNILNSGRLVYADGIGVVLAGRLRNQYLPCRITAIDIFHQLCDAWQNKGTRLYLLGASEKNIVQATANLKAAHPNLIIAGFHHGFFKASTEEQEIIQDINSKFPDILLVGLGAPLQEEWVHRNLKKLNAQVFWCVGGLFDLLSGNLKRGPRVLHQNHLEWFCRLLITPEKVWKRYLIGNPLFIYRAMKNSKMKATTKS